MLLRDGVLYSTLLEDLPVLHGFTTRLCGNLGFGKNPGDPEVIENRKKLFDRLDLASRTLIQPKQIHSGVALKASEFRPGAEGDASYSRDPQDLLSILTADCVPILLFHQNGIVAAIHAGWRGLEADIIPRTLELLPSGCIGVIGPAIGACCYEVGDDLAARFEKRFGSQIVSVVKSKLHLDLVGVAVQQLHSSNVGALDVSHLCTMCHPDLFFSYRRDGSSGRQMSFIGLNQSNASEISEHV